MIIFFLLHSLFMAHLTVTVSFTFVHEKGLETGWPPFQTDSDSDEEKTLGRREFYSVTIKVLELLTIQQET